SSATAPRCSPASTCWATTSRWVTPARAARTARACRSATGPPPCGSRASPSAARPRSAGGAEMSDELFALADRVLAGARGGEQVEVVVERARDTQVRVYEGQVESLSSAESQGVGVRVVVDGRQGFAYAGTLDPSAIEEALADARDNAGFATPDECAGLAEPDGVPVPQLDLFHPALA